MVRRLVAALAALLLMAAVFTHRREVVAVAEAAARARPEWLLAALLLQASSAACLAELNRRALAAIAVRIRFSAAWATQLATLAANLLAPSAGAAGVALWVDALGRRGAPRPKVAAAILAASLLDLAALGALVVLAVVHVGTTRVPSPIEIASAAMLIALLAAGTAAIVIAARRPAFWEEPLFGAQKLLGRIAGRWSRWRPDPGWPERTAALLGEAARTLASRPRLLIQAALFALAEHAASVGGLAALSLAFGQDLAPLPLLTCYALAMLVWVASPVPQGIGLVEAALAGALTAAGTPAPTATLIALTHRGLTFWLPLGVGFLILWRLETASPR